MSSSQHPPSSALAAPLSGHLPPPNGLYPGHITKPPCVLPGRTAGGVHVAAPTSTLATPHGSSADAGARPELMRTTRSYSESDPALDARGSNPLSILDSPNGFPAPRSFRFRSPAGPRVTGRPRPGTPLPSPASQPAAHCLPTWLTSVPPRDNIDHPAGGPQFPIVRDANQPTSTPSRSWTPVGTSYLGDDEGSSSPRPGDDEDSAAPGQLAYLASEIHDLCLLSTQDWITEHVVNAARRSAAANPFRRARHRHHHRHRAEPYAASRLGQGAAGSVLQMPEATDSLLANVSIVCSMLWTRAQRDRLVVPGTERMALENMGCLMEWAETVVLWEARLAGLGVAEALGTLEGAGRAFCGWMGDDARADIVEGLVMDVENGLW